MHKAQQGTRAACYWTFWRLSAVTPALCIHDCHTRCRPPPPPPTHTNTIISILESSACYECASIACMCTQCIPAVAPTTQLCHCCCCQRLWVDVREHTLIAAAPQLLLSYCPACGKRAAPNPPQHTNETHTTCTLTAIPSTMPDPAPSINKTAMPPELLCSKYAEAHTHLCHRC